jgi:hypothetical protein
MKKAGLLIMLIALAALLPKLALAATCSCAGAPLVSAMDTTSTEAGDLFISLTSEQHEISDLVQGSKTIPDETGRRRSSLSQALSFSYGLSDRWALSGLLSYVQHEREVGSSFFGKQQSSGLGDSVLMLRYSPVYITPFSRHEISLGLGARLPTGRDDAGGLITFAEDMQPSSGAAATILWASHLFAFDQAATKTLTTSAYYTRNDDENSRGYVFGDEFVVGVGFTQNLGTRFSYSAGLRYRQTTADQRVGFDIPNTGGQWLDFTPAVNYTINDNLDIGVSGRIPAYREVEGAVQFSTSYAYALTVTYGF